MSRVQTKICGLSTPETLDAAVAGGTSHVGFNFYPPSPRSLTIDKARGLAGRVPSHVTRVGIFVDPDDALLAAATPFIDEVQLHGALDPARAAAIRARGKPVWQAIPIRASGDLAAAGSFTGAADRILYDAKTPDDAALPGGMGVRFDWRLLKGVRHPLPWALSGGLDADSVGAAVAITGATLVDVSSGVENAPGVKDVDKIKAFLQAVHQL